MQFPPARIVIASMLVGVVVIASQLFLNGLRGLLSLHGSGLLNGLALIIFVPATAAAYLAYVNLIEHRSVSELSPHGAIQETCAAA